MPPSLPRLERDMPSLSREAFRQWIRDTGKWFLCILNCIPLQYLSGDEALQGVLHNANSFNISNTFEPWKIDGRAASDMIMKKMYAVLQGKTVKTWAHGRTKLAGFPPRWDRWLVQPKPETMQYILTSVSRFGKAFELSVFAELIHKLVLWQCIA